MSNWEKTMKEWDDSVPDGIKYLSAEKQVLMRRVRELESENARLKDAQRWIPVSERLPENSDGILIWAGYYHGIGCYSTIYSSPKFFDGLVLMKEHRGVTHWMPLPEPPIVYGKVCEE